MLIIFNNSCILGLRLEWAGLTDRSLETVAFWAMGRWEREVNIRARAHTHSRKHARTQVHTHARTHARTHVHTHARTHARTKKKGTRQHTNTHTHSRLPSSECGTSGGLGLGGG